MKFQNKERIKIIRESMNMTQKEYADYLGINLRCVQNWEYRGTNDTTFILIKKIYQMEYKLKKYQMEYKLKKQRENLKNKNMVFELPFEK